MIVRGVVEDGLIPSEKIVRITTADGRQEEVAVSASQVRDSGLEAQIIGSEDDKVLIELPRESSSGRWRVWIHKDQVLVPA